MNRDELIQLRDRQIAFLAERLVSDAAKAEWRASARAAFEHLLDQPVGALVDEAALERAVDAVTSVEAATRFGAPLASVIVDLVEARLAEDDRPIGDYVPTRAQNKLDELLEQPGLLPPALVREALENDAAEEILRDTLHDALREFSDKANPLKGEWGLLAFLKNYAPMGLSIIGKSLEGFQREFDKRMEPEMKKFLAGFSRRALRKIADETIRRSDEEAFVSIRKHMATWALGQPVSALAATPSERARALGRAFAIDTAAHAASLEQTRRAVKQTLGELVAAHRDEALGDVLGRWGVRPAVVDVEALADATWPAAREALGSDAARAWIATVVGEFFAAEMGA